jgi:hypothetical protein
MTFSCQLIGIDKLVHGVQINTRLVDQFTTGFFLRENYRALLRNIGSNTISQKASSEKARDIVHPIARHILCTCELRTEMSQHIGCSFNMSNYKGIKR